MLDGSLTKTAYFVMPAAIRTMSTSWSPSWRSPSTSWQAMHVSRLTCPEITKSGTESVHAPKTPLSALMPPGPVVTFNTRPCRTPARNIPPPSRTPVRGIANVPDARFAADRIIQVHRPATGDQEDVGYTPVGQLRNDVVGQFHSISIVVWRHRARFYSAKCGSPDRPPVL